MNKLIFIIIAIYLITVFLMALIIPIFKKIRLGQVIRKEGPKKHRSKSGTPTMGGVIIVFVTLFMYFLLKILLKEKITIDDLIVLTPFVSFFIIGLIDDLKSIRKHDNTGLSVKGKFFLELFVSALFYFLILYINNDNLLNFFGCFVDLKFFYGILILILLTGVTNATNFTDGIDGLLGSTMVSSFISLALYAYLLNINSIFILCLTVVMVILGFLTFNLNVAKIFMGDTGSLALGALMVSILIYLKSEVLIIFFGFIYLVELFSVMLQVWFFKRSKGDRIFKMTPLHHHFELSGFSENFIDLMFSLINLIMSLLGVFIGVRYL